MKLLFSILGAVLGMNGVFVLAIVWLDASFASSRESWISKQLSGFRPVPVEAAALAGSYTRPRETLELHAGGMFEWARLVPDGDNEFPPFIHDRGRWTLDGTALALDCERWRDVELAVGKRKDELLLVGDHSFWTRSQPSWQR